MQICDQDALTFIVILLASTLAFATPITLGALSGVACERAGVVNIGIEGMMLMGAFFGYVAGVNTGSVWMGVLAAILTGGVLALLHAVLSVTYKVDQIISGTVINILAVGMTGYLFTQWFGSSAPFVPGTLPRIHIPLLADIPVVGRLFEQQPVALSAILLVGVAHFVLYHTPIGLRVRAVGENPRAADTVGIPVRRVRYMSVVVGGLLAGLGGAYFVPEFLSSFSREMTAGRGFIALAAMIFGRWTPFGAWGAALFFGLMLAGQNNLQSCGVGIPAGIVGMLPYIATILVLAGLVGRSTPPAADGVPY
jgi:simple sugar transport system permease protein